MLPSLANKQIHTDKSGSLMGTGQKNTKPNNVAYAGQRDLEGAAVIL